MLYFLIFKTEVQLIYSIALVSGVQQSANYIILILYIMFLFAYSIKKKESNYDVIIQQNYLSICFLSLHFQQILLCFIT